MHITSQKSPGDHFTHQLQVKITLGLLVELKVVFRSSGRDSVSYEIFDQFGDSMGRRSYHYGMGMAKDLVDDLNVLLEEFGVQLNSNNLTPICHDVYLTCESRYGNGIAGGDAVITIS